jgi:hypothetical protein
MDVVGNLFLMRILTIVLVVILVTCCSRDNNDALLSARLREIEELDYFDNGVVVFTEKSGYGSTFSRWQPDYDFYQDDVVFDSTARFYRALADNIGKPPNSSPKEWEFLHRTTHPYFFLRDTARTDDLKRLLKHKHPYIRTYAFGALAKRDKEGLFNVIIDNLSDTTRI